MSVPVAVAAPRGVLRHSRRDALLVGLALAHGAVLLAAPAVLTVAVGLWWNANTVSHYFIHKPYFRSRRLNGLFSCYLSVLLGLPQSVWRDRHLAHHAGVPWRLRVTPRLVVEAGLVGGLWVALACLAPWFLLTAYLPGFAVGLFLCWVHGHYEHAGGTVSHHGRVYNLLFFNDGYHVEHHAATTTHWAALPRAAGTGVAVSRWPAVLRWLDAVSLEALERLVLRCRPLRWAVLAAHRRAFRALLPAVGGAARVGIVGGGLFPRTALVLRQLLPAARLVVIDADAGNVETARAFPLGDTEFVTERYDPGRHTGFDLVVVPLAYVGDRGRLYRDPPAPHLLVHDWVWNRWGRSAVVSWLLLKRLNLVTR